MTPKSKHWQHVYETRAPDEVSWFQPVAGRSLSLIADSGLPKDAALLDVGGGASVLAGQLLQAGYRDISVADLSASALQRAQDALGKDAERIAWIEADLRRHRFGRTYDLWHDRAVFHFMVEPTDRRDYLATLAQTLRPRGHLILATFGPAGPTRCSGLPVRRYDADDLSRVLGSAFKLVSEHRETHQTPARSGQQFIYAHFVRDGSPEDSRS